jgi:hypothetical protein
MDIVESMATEHTATPANNNLSITRFGRSLSLSSETAAEFPQGNIDSDTSGVYCLHIA